MSGQFDPPRRADTETPEPAPKIPKPLPRPELMARAELDRCQRRLAELRAKHFPHRVARDTYAAPVAQELALDDVDDPEVF